MVVIVASACGGPSNAVSCNENANCNLSSGGMCVSTTSGQWCAYPDPGCPSGYRYSDQSVGGGLSGQCVPEQDAVVDAGIDADTRTWSEPERLFPPGEFAFSAQEPTVSPNRRELFFTGSPGGILPNIYFFSRPDATEFWGEDPHDLTEVNTSASEVVSCISSTGLEVIFTGDSDQYSVRRSSTEATWGTPVPLGFGGHDACLAAGDLTLYYEDSIDCPGEACLRKRTRSTPTAAWGPASVEVLPAGSGGYQTIEVAADDLSIVFSTPIDLGMAPVAISTRPSQEAAWSPVRPISELSAFAIRHAKLSPAGDEMYLTLGPASNSLEFYVSRLR
jgi:hypothetical protein